MTRVSTMETTPNIAAAPTCCHFSSHTSKGCIYLQPRPCSKCPSVAWLFLAVAITAAILRVAEGTSTNCTNQPQGSYMVARINCGGPAVEYPMGCKWTADDTANPYANKTSGADRLESSAACDPATNPGGPLACNMRWSGTPINYTFPADWGRTYLVVVQLSEVYFTTPGNRSVNIFVNGVRQYADIDPFVAGGGRFRPTTYSSTIDFRPNLALGVPTGGFNLSVGLTATKDYPCVSAIEMYDVSDVPHPRPSAGVIGGAVGGAAGAVLLCIVGFYLYRRHKREQLAQRSVVKAPLKPVKPAPTAIKSGDKGTLPR